MIHLQSNFRKTIAQMELYKMAKRINLVEINDEKLIRDTNNIKIFYCL